MQFGRATLGQGAPDDVNMLVRLAWEIGGAIAFGTLIGALFALYLRYIRREVTLALLVVTLILSQVGMTQRVEPLLAAMAAGIVIANVAVAQGETLKAAIQSGALPLLVVFFVAVGTSLRLDTLAASGAAALSLAAARIGLIWLAVRAGLRVANVSDRAGDYIWTGLDLAGGDHAGTRRGGRERVPDVGHASAAAARLADCHRRARRTCIVPHRPGTSGRNRRACAAPAAGRVEPRTVPA